MPFEPRILGRRGLQVAAIGLAASYGAPADAVEYAFENGVNYFYWGSMRPAAFGEGLQRLAAKRDRYASRSRPPVGASCSTTRTPAGERTPAATDCYRFALANPSVDLCMSGPSDMQQTRQAIRALELGPMADEEQAWKRRLRGAIYRTQVP